MSGHHDLREANAKYLFPSAVRIFIRGFLFVQVHGGKLVDEQGTFLRFTPLLETPDRLLDPNVQLSLMRTGTSRVKPHVA